MNRDRDREHPEYELHEEEISRRGQVGQPAGLYWLNGRCLFASHDSRMEERLLALGAVLIATLRFDRDPLEGVHPGHTVERVDAVAAARAFLVSGAS